MANHIDWYIVELERRLSGRIPAEQLFALTSEVEDHLSLKTEDLAGAGMSIEQARRTAVESFGHADEVADEALESATNVGSKRSGILWTLGSAGVLYFLISLIGFNGFEPVLTLASFALSIALIVMFCRGSVRAQRPLKLPLLLIGLAGTLALAIVLPYGFALRNGSPSSRYWLRNEQGWGKRELARFQAAERGLSSGLAYYRALAAAHGDQDKVKLQEPKRRDGKPLKLPTYWNYDPGQVGVTTFQSYYPPTYYGVDEKAVTVTEAMNDWLARGPEMLADTRRQIESQKLNAAFTAAAIDEPPSHTRLTLLWASGVGGVTFLVLLGLNTASLSISRKARRRRTRKPVLA